MKLRLEQTKRFLLLAAPIVMASAIAPSPTQAATFASSEASVQIYNFNTDPFEVGALVDSNQSTTATAGVASAVANGTATFHKDDPNNPTDFTYAENSSSGIAKGKGGEYTANVTSFAGVTGYNFFVGANQSLKFDFTAILNLATTVDSPTFESASAAGQVAFKLFNTTGVAQDNLAAFLSTANPIDSFLLSGIVTNPGSPDFYGVTNNGSGFTYNSSSSGGQNSAGISARGSFSRLFSQATQLTLVETKENYAAVQAVPSPTLIPGFLISSAVVAFRRRLRKKGAAVA